MKVLILAGGLGSRLGEETQLIPKPMVKIGSKPILWHIMKLYAMAGFNEFILLLGYKSDVIKDYFINYKKYSGNIEIDLSTDTYSNLSNVSENWKITMLETGEETLTGSRIKQARQFTADQPFLLTYGDGVANIDLKKLVSFHKKKKRYLTMTSVQPDGRFGTFEADEDDIVTSFVEKPKGQGSWINGGFFVCEPEIFNYISDGSKVIFEESTMQALAREKKIATYRHNGFWKCMDTIKDKKELEKLGCSAVPPWQTWT